jgi:hypothetical protein
MPAIPKPLRGSEVLKREAKRAEARTRERFEKGVARRRDGGCRWPIKHVCRGGLEAAHVRDASLGGEMESDNLITLCAWIHRRGPESIHGKQLKVEPETGDGADGPCSFYRLDDNGMWMCVGVESSLGVLMKN